MAIPPHLLDNALTKAIMDGLDPDAPFEPLAYYDEDGDCIEYIADRGPFYAKRFNKTIDVYYNRATDQPIGMVIHGATRPARLKKMLAELLNTKGP